MRARPPRRDDRAPRRRRGRAGACRRSRRFRVLCRDDGRRRHPSCSPPPPRAMPRTAETFLAAAAEACGCADRAALGRARGASSRRSASSRASTQPDGIVGDMGGGSLELVDVAGDDVGRGHHACRLGGLALQDCQRQLAEEGAEDRARGARARRAAAEPQGPHLLRRRRHLARARPPAPGRPRLSAARHARLRRSTPRTGSISSSSSRRPKPRRLKEIEAVSEARRPLLAYGAIVLEEIIRARAAGRDRPISALGVREGLLYEMLDAEGARRSIR